MTKRKSYNDLYATYYRCCGWFIKYKNSGNPDAKSLIDLAIIELKESLLKALNFGKATTIRQEGILYSAQTLLERLENS